MPVVPRHLGVQDDARVKDGAMVIPWIWGVATAAGTTTYNMFGSNGLETPRLAFMVTNAWGIVTGGAGAGTIVVNHVSTTGTVSAITDVANLAGLGLADTDLFDFSEVDDDYWEISLGENLQVVTTANALALVQVVCTWSA